MNPPKILLPNTENSRIWPTIFGEPCNIIFVFFNYFISVFPSGEVRTFHPLSLRPCSWAYQFRENSLRNDTAAKYTILIMDPEKMQACLSSIHKMTARRPPEKSLLFSLFGAPQVTQHSVGC